MTAVQPLERPQDLFDRRWMGIERPYTTEEVDRLRGFLTQMCVYPAGVSLIRRPMSEPRRVSSST